MEALRPDSDEEKLQISSTNWNEGTARSCKVGGAHFVVKAKIRSATKQIEEQPGEGVTLTQANPGEGGP